jgi:hypothetical protein
MLKFCTTYHTHQESCRRAVLHFEEYAWYKSERPGWMPIRHFQTIDRGRGICGRFFEKRKGRREPRIPLVFPLSNL